MGRDDIIAATQNIIQSKLGHEFSVTLFGSQQTEKARAGSDYDFLIDGPRALSIIELAEIKHQLNGLPTLHKIDIVDRHHITADFLAVAES